VNCLGGGPLPDGRGSEKGSRVGQKIAGWISGCGSEKWIGKALSSRGLELTQGLLVLKRCESAGNASERTFVRSIAMLCPAVSSQTNPESDLVHRIGLRHKDHDPWHRTRLATLAARCRRIAIVQPSRTKCLRGLRWFGGPASGGPHRGRLQAPSIGSGDCRLGVA